MKHERGDMDRHAKTVLCRKNCVLNQQARQPGGNLNIWTRITQYLRKIRPIRPLEHFEPVLLMTRENNAVISEMLRKCWSTLRPLRPWGSCSSKGIYSLDMLSCERKYDHHWYRSRDGSRSTHKILQASCTLRCPDSSVYVFDRGKSIPTERHTVELQLPEFKRSSWTPNTCRRLPYGLTLVLFSSSVVNKVPQTNKQTAFVEIVQHYA